MVNATLGVPVAGAAEPQVDPGSNGAAITQDAPGAAPPREAQGSPPSPPDEAEVSADPGDGIAGKSVLR